MEYRAGSTLARYLVALLRERKRAERRYHRATGLPERRAAYQDLVAVKDELARYRRAEVRP